jgi:septal ring factor EnvC (AmiA/AmiB activator)
VNSRSGEIAGVLLAAAAAATLAGRAASKPPRDDLAAINARQVALDAQLGATRAELARVLGALELYGRNLPPALLVSPGDARDAVRAAILMRATLPALEARARELAGEARALDAARRPAAMASGELFVAESALADRQGRGEGVTEDAGALAPPGVRGGPPTATVKLVAPVQGAVTTGFGSRGPDGAPSRGLWYAARPGAAVASPAAGVVDFAGPVSGWGMVLIVRGPGASHMVLSGLASASVGRGAQVGAGQVVGTMGSAGHSPPRLYFEFRLDGAPVDPSPLMAGAAPQTAGLKRKLL